MYIEMSASVFLRGHGSGMVFHTLLPFSEHPSRGVSPLLNRQDVLEEVPTATSADAAQEVSTATTADVAQEVSWSLA